MKYTFTCRGHPNIKAEHNRTIEFTKDIDLTERGDCIVGVSADFSSIELKKLTGKIKITIEIGDLTDTFKAYANPKFDDDGEIVFRKSRYRSARTLGTDLNKGSSKLDRDMVKVLQDPDTVMTVTIETMKKGAEMDINKDNIVDSYRDHRGYWLGKSRVSERYLEVIGDIIYPTDRILDLGCGGGRMIFLLSGNFDKGVGVDISSDLIQGAVEKAAEMDLSNVFFQQGDLEEESTWDQCRDRIGGEQFDLIISNLMIRKDCCSAGKIIEKAYRSLRDGGRIALRIQDEKDLNELGYPSPCYGRNEIMISMREAGFREAEIEKEVFHQNFSSAEFLMTFLERTGLKKYYENKGWIDQIERKLKHISTKKGIRLQRHYLIATGEK